ncbi:MAG: tetratricopeptide repeat protein, partial [Bacteroidota bacterium]
KIMLYALRDQYDLANLSLIAYYHDQHQTEASIQACEAALASGSNQLTILCKLTELLIEAGQFGAAKERLNQAIAIDPAFLPLFPLRGELWLRSKNYPKAAAAFKHYVARNPSDHQASMRYAAVLFLNGDYAAAMTEFDHLEKAGVSPALVQRLKAYSFYETERFAEAAATLDRYFTIQAADRIIATDYVYLGKISLARGKQAQADEAFGQAVEMDSEQAAVYQDLSQQYRKEKDYRQQAHYLHLFLLAESNTQSAEWLQLGKAYYFAQEFEAAQKVFSALVEEDDEYVAALYWLGETLRKAHPNRPQASWQPYFTKVVELLELESELNDAQTRWMLGSVTALAIHFYAPENPLQKDCEQAVVYLEKLVHLKPDQTAYQLMLDSCR